MSEQESIYEQPIGAVPGQGWTLRNEDGVEYPVVAFVVGRHWAHPICVMATKNAMVYTPESWRSMELIPPSGAE